MFGFSKEKEPIQPGKFIVIEGMDGTGKTTQVDLLAQTLSEFNYEGVIFDFPQYSQASSSLLQSYLAGQYGQLGPEAASILYAVDRFDASFKMKEEIAKGRIILANRYATSNSAHQGAKIADDAERIKFYKWVDNLEYNIFNIPKPDLTIILHVPLEQSLELIRRGHETKGTHPDLHDQDIEYLKQTEAIYEEIAQLFPNTKMIECFEDGRLLSPNEVHVKVWELVRRMVLKNNSF